MKTRIHRVLTDKIVLMVMAYVVFIICSFATIFIMDDYVHKRLKYINSVYYNETSKIQLNDLLKNKIINLESLILTYTMADDFSVMDKYEKDLSRVLESIVRILYVIEQGGEYSEELSVNYKGLELSQHKVSYTNFYSGKYNIQVMDLRAKLIDIKNLIDDFRGIVIDLLIARQSNNLEMINNINQRESIAVKSLEAFFVRMDESSNRLYLEAAESESYIKNYLNQTISRFRQLTLQINIILGLIIVIAGLLLVVKIYKTVKERAEYSDEINELNDKLEETVLSRTEELKSEVRIRKEKEQESSKKAQFLMEVIESLGHPFYVIDANTYEIILANTAAYEVIGGSGNTCYELTHHSNHPCDSIDHPCPLKKVIETGSATSVEHIHVVKNGEKRYVEVHGYPVKDEDGNVVKMIEYSLDITARKDMEVFLMNLNSMLEEKVTERTKKLKEEIKNREIAEENLNIREHHFKQLITNISDIIVIVDNLQRIKYISPSIEHLCGFNPEQLIGKSFDDLVHGRDNKIFNIWFENLLKSPDELKTVELRIQKQSGMYMHGEAVANNLLSDDVINGVIINVRDISIRKRAEEEVRKLALVMEQNPNSILVTDIDGKIEYVNPAFERITGYSLTEVIGKNPRILKTDDTPSEVFDHMWRTITKGNTWKGEFVNKTKSGELYVEHAIITPIKNGRGETKNYLGMKENITELKQARLKAEESNKAKSMFLANMSHEIRTPLNGLMGFLDLLSQTHMDTEQKDYVNTIKFSANALLKILNDILDLSKIESGMLELEKVEIDLGYNLLSTAKSFYAKANNAGIHLDTYIDPQVPVGLLGDSLRINQVVSNLLNNAIKFTPGEGHIKVGLELLSETNRNATVRVMLEDTGQGIPPEKTESIFESFAQADSSVTRKYGGTGLGLTISKNLLRMMGTEINVESEVGKGSKFYFDLTLDKTISTDSNKKVANDKKVYIYGDGEVGLYSIIEKYLKSFEAEYQFIDKIDGEQDYSESIIIFNTNNYEDSLASALADKGANVICVLNYMDNTSVDSLDDRITVLGRPFCGQMFYEALTGEVFKDDRQHVERKDNLLFDGQVLLAEDDRVNIKLIESMLEGMGLDVDVALDGAEAAYKATVKKYDIVLMDINMPEMDGATSTKKIREYEKSFYKDRTPIIAFTAHTLNEINDNSPDNDFDGYLSKPIQANELENILKKYLPEIVVDNDETQKVMDLDVIVQEIGLPEEIVKKLIVGYCKNLENDIQELISIADEGATEKLKSLIHSHKGAANNLRMREIIHVFNKIEDSVRVKDKDGIMKGIEELSTDVTKILEIVDLETL